MGRTQSLFTSIVTPYDVFPSTKHFYSSLLHELSLQNYRHIDIASLVLGAYSAFNEHPAT